MSNLFKAITPPANDTSGQVRPDQLYPRRIAAGAQSPSAELSARWHLEDAEQPGSDSISLDQLFRRLWRSRLLLLSGGFVGALAIGLWSLQSTPIYRARTAIQLQELNERFPNLPDMPDGNSVTPGEMYLQNELKILQSDSLALRVSAAIGLKPAAPPSSVLSSGPIGKWLKPYTAVYRTPSSDDLRILAVQRALTIRSSLKTQVVEVLFDSPDPEFAAKGANAVVLEYVASNREARLEASRETNEWLTEQIADLKVKLDKGNAELQAFASASGLLFASNQSLLSEESTRHTQDDLSRAHADLAAKQARYDAAVSNSPEALPSGADSGLLREYEGKFATAQSELTELRGLYTPTHYKVVEAEVRVAQLDAAIKQERQRIISRMKAEYDAARRLEESLSATYGVQTRELTQQTAAAFRYNVLKRDLESTELLYNSLLQKTKEAGVTSAMEATSVRILDPARVPDAPYSPNVPVNASVGFAGGLFLAMGIVLTRHRDVYLPQRNAQAKVAVRELGAIPTAKGISRRKDWPAALFGAEAPAGAELAAWYDQSPELTEAFRATLASILFSPVLDRRNHLVLTVTSVQAKEGKTTAVTNLGIALAETHGRVLLIDGDMRRPRLHEIFGHCNDVGLTTVLTGEEPIATLNLENLIRETPVNGLFTLPSGPGVAAIVPLLYSERMSRFLAHMRNEFDYILIDTPPASLFSDARILGRQSDGLIVVVRVGKTTHDELNAVCATFSKDGTRIVGTIVNQTTGRARGYDQYVKKTN